MGEKFGLVAAFLIAFGFAVGMSTGSIFFKPQVISEAAQVFMYPASPSPIPTPPPALSIMLTGDIMLGRSVNRQSLESRDFTWPFTYVYSELAQADITVSNLENAIVPDCPLMTGGFTFCAPVEAVTGLTFAGIDVVSLANNHSTNFGIQGLADTQQALEDADISVIGVGEPAIVTHNDTTVAFLGYNDIGNLAAVAKADSEKIAADIISLRDRTDIVVVFIHWGEEYKRDPNTRQIEIARAAVDAGADAVIGHHPHWVQTKETYNGKPIYYSLGNFIFDQEWSRETKEGLAVKLNYQSKQLVGIEELPVLIQDYGQPHWMNSEESEAFLGKIGYRGRE